MSRFKAIEEAENAATLARQREERRVRGRVDKFTICEHRKPVGFYNVKCIHPERTKGGQCVGVDCPILFD